jgi:CRISPR-associated endoribonuclease Cas6
MDHFEIAKFVIVLSAQERARLPEYKGSTLRGSFGHAFKRTVCPVPNQGCRQECQMPNVCPYSYIFETPPPSNSQMMRKYTHAPHPFVIEPPLTEQTIFHPGDKFELGLVLVGRSIDYLPYFVYSFVQLANRGLGKGRAKFILNGVDSLGLGDERRAIFDSQSQKLSNRYFRMKASEIINVSCDGLDLGCISVTFLTPVRLKYDGHLAKSLEFHVLLRNLLRRLSLLSYFHCGGELEIDYKGLIEGAKSVSIHDDSGLSWFDWQRYSQRQGTKMSMGGLVGNITYSGNLEEFIPFLRLGEWVHVGKGTSFGLGKYVLNRIKDEV